MLLESLDYSVPKVTKFQSVHGVAVELEGGLSAVIGC